MKSIRYSVVALLLAFILIVQSCAFFNSIPSPQNVTIQNKALDWDPVDGADEYYVYIGEHTFNCKVSSLALDSLGLESGDYSIYVVAVKGEVRSPASITISYKVVRSIQEETIIESLKLFDTSYRIDMRESDFTTTQEYEKYKDVLIFIDAYESATSNSGLRLKAIPLLKTTLEWMQDPMTNITKAFQEYRDLQIPGEKIAQLMIQLSSLGEDWFDGFGNTIIQKIYESKEDHIRAFGVVFDYILGISELLDNQTIINAMMNPNIVDLLYAFNMKDSLVPVFVTMLPSVEEIAKTYRIIKLFADVMSIWYFDRQDFNQLPYNDEVINEYAEYLHTSMSLVLAFLEDFDLTTYQKITYMLLFKGATYDVTDELGNILYTVTESINMESVVDFILYLNTYIESFKERHLDLVTKYKNLQTNNLEGSMINYLGGYFFGDALISEPSLAYIRHFLNNWYLYENFAELYQELGREQFSHFITTQGQIVLDINKIYLHIENANLQNLVFSFESLIQGLKEYQAIMEEHISLTGIELFIELAISEASLIVDQTNNEAVLPFLSFASDLHPILERILYVWLLRGDLLIASFENAMDRVYESEEWFIDFIPEQVLFYTLHSFLIEENKNLLESHIRQIIQEMKRTGRYDSMDLGELETKLFSDLSIFYQDLDVIVTYDFNHLSVEQEEKIATIFNFLDFSIYSK